MTFVQRALCISLSLSLITVAADASGKRKVLIIGIDGCRSDALQAANAPNIKALAAAGTTSWDALTIPPTVSGPCWSSMLTGVWYTKHGVSDNSFNNSNYGTYPHFFKRVEAFDSALITASISQWSPIDTYIANPCDLKPGANGGADVAAKAAALLHTGDPDALFLQFDDVDGAGHTYGYGPAVPDYLATIARVDGYVGTVIAAIHARPSYPDEDWLILLSADHGGTAGGGHGGASFEERNIFFIASGDHTARRIITRDTTVAPVTYSIPPYALNLDSTGGGLTGSFVAVPDNPAWHFGAGQDFSIECCVKTAGWMGDPALISNKNWDSGMYKGFVLAANGGGWKVNAGDGSHRVDLNGATINDNKWHHLTATFRRTGEVTTYQDGEKLGATSMGAVGDVTTGMSLGIGQDGTLNYYYKFNGLINEVRIWNTALADSTIRQWTFRPVDSTHADYASLIGYWKMSDGHDTIATDFSLLHNNGVVHGPGASWATPHDEWQVASFDYSHTPRIVDVAVTALNWLGVPIDTAWHLDGAAINLAVNPATVNNRPAAPEEFRLEQNYPNPFNPTTGVRFQVSGDSKVKLVVYDVLGREVAVLVNERKASGTHTVKFDGRGLASGVYFYRLTARQIDGGQAGSFVQSRKMILVR